LNQNLPGPEWANNMLRIKSGKLVLPLKEAKKKMLVLKKIIP